MRRFQVVRHIDVSGTSGTGVVCEGIEFSNGKVAIAWMGEYPSVVVWESFEHAEYIHGHGGATEFRWID